MAEPVINANSPLFIMGIPKPYMRIAEFIPQCQIAAPGQLCNALLHNCPIRPGVGKLPHVLEVAWREPAHVRKSGLQVMRKPVDHPGAPSFLLLALQDKLTDVPMSGGTFRYPCQGVGNGHHHVRFGSSQSFSAVHRGTYSAFTHCLNPILSRWRFTFVSSLATRLTICGSGVS